MSNTWPLVGRDQDLADVTAAVIGGEHKGVLIAGEPGVGKTRLALEGIAAVAGDRGGRWVVRRVAGTASGRSVPLGAFARYTTQPEAGGAAAIGQVIAALGEDVGDARLLVFVDDAHQLDDLSALVVSQLVVTDTAVVIATTVTGEPVPDALTALWKDALLRRVELQALSRDETERLLQEALGAPLSAGCAEQFWDFTRGNVLFLRHLVDQERATGRLTCRGGRWCWTPGPIVSPSLIELVEKRIGAVPEHIREVVDLVAVAEPIDPACLTEVVDTASLEAAEQHGLIRIAQSGDAVYVGHPLYGQARRTHCGPMRLRRLRGRVATALARAQTHSIVDPLRLGLLWLESDLPPDPAILTAAAVVARSRLDLETAERLARAAVDADAGALTKLLLAYILFMREKGLETERVLDDIGDQDMRLSAFVNPVILRAANRLWVMRQPERSWEVIGDALRNRSGDATDLHAFRAVQLSLAGRPAETLQEMAAVDHARLDNFGRILALCAQTLALAELGRAKEAVESAAAGYAVVSSAPQESYQGTATAEFHAFALLAAGYVQDAIAAAEERHRICVDMPGMISPVATAVLGMTMLGAGDLTSALRHLRGASDGLGGYGDISGIFYRFSIAQTEALARSGQVDAAMAALSTTQHLRHPAYASAESGYLLSTAWVAAVRGRVTEALRFTSKATQFAHSHGQWARELLCLQIAVQFGDGGAAARLRELGSLVEGPRAAVCHRYAEALADQEPAVLEQVSGELEAMGDMLAAADAAAHAAICYRQAGRRGSALTARTRAQRLARRCGGATSPALAAAKISLPFTKREHEIAALVAQGLSNREIAETTSLSVRTVEGYVLRATTKAGVANRAELAILVSGFEDPAAP